MKPSRRGILVALGLLALTGSAFALGVLVGPWASNEAAAQANQQALVSSLAQGGSDQVLRGDTFRRLAAATKPAVVSITTSHEGQTRRPRGNQPDPGEDPWEFFERFFGPRGQRPPVRPDSFGSGVIISPGGDILTNNHVVEDAATIEVALQDGRTFEAEVIGADPETDIALVRIEGDDLPAVPLGDSDSLEVGDWVMAIGNPFQFRYSVTVGVVSAKERAIGVGPYDDFIQTDAAINPGNSGGPLIGLNGSIVGINTAIISGGFRQSAGVGFAIPVNLIREILPQLREKGRVERGYLGVGIQDISPEIARGLDLDNTDGVLVTEVQEGTPAEEAGLQEYDVITAWNGEKVVDTRELMRRVAATAPGEDASVRVLRNGRRKTFKLTVANRGEALGQPERRAAPANSLGMEVQTITPELAQRLDLPVDRGVLVSSVDPGSVAQRAGLRRGDVILEANTQRLEDVGDLRGIIGDSAGDTLILRIRRGTTSLILPIEVPE